VTVSRLNALGIGRHDAVDVGGDSILAIKLAMSMCKALDIDRPLVEFYAAPTIREQARLIDRLLVGETL